MEEPVGDVKEEPGDLPASGYDPDALAAFLATAPAGLQGWADEQLAQLNAARPAADAKTDTEVEIVSPHFFDPEGERRRG